ncbi:bile acid:sodium symporter family protein [Pontixanthobacter aquaemixtae]|uniref:Bile acid:sodium symporter n=1 Tax=Pontixanthobacter aquaemixtae TaxID=1958940 RepID=A0A844ZSM4_9SPHN|nr:bile acid:sodium symporter family protein [Pontixanthobacter aquaemixtae]MXO90120.1 bile acid:sodium symporter [Pontixanthobacter aquaemixtae]
MLRILTNIDLMVRLLILAIALATVFPAVGTGREIAQVISNIGIFSLFFLNGVRLSRGEVLAGIGNWRLLLPLTLWCFGAMALAGWGLSALGEGVLPAFVALGLLYLGVLPSTVQSATAYTSIAGGNVASSVVSAALLNIIGVFISAPIFAWLSGGALVQLGPEGVFKIFIIVLLPFAMGQILQTRLQIWLGAHPSLVGWMDRIAIAIAVYVAFSGAVEQGLWSKLDPAGWGWLVLIIGAFLAFGFAGAWILSRGLALAPEDRISFTFAGAHKSLAMGAPLALVLFTPESAGMLLVPLLLYHLLQLVVSAPLAKRFSNSLRRL